MRLFSGLHAGLMRWIPPTCLATWGAGRCLPMHANARDVSIIRGKGRSGRRQPSSCLPAPRGPILFIKQNTRLGLISVSNRSLSGSLASWQRRSSSYHIIGFDPAGIYSIVRVFPENLLNSWDLYVYIYVDIFHKVFARPNRTLSCLLFRLRKIWPFF